MSPCEQYQSQFLAYVYGLLDEADGQAIAKHATECPVCLMALGKAREHQKALAVAAKASFPSVKFEHARPTTTRELVAPRKWSWAALAIAASVILAIFGTAFYSVYTIGTYQRNIADAQVDLNRAIWASSQARHRQEEQDREGAERLAEIQKKLSLVEAQYADEIKKVQKDLENQDVQFRVTHPPTLEAGARNQLQVEAKAKSPDLKKMRMVAVLVNDKSKAELFRKPLHEGVNDVVLPADLPLSPGASLTLRVIGMDDGSKASTAEAAAAVLAPNFFAFALPAIVLAGKTQQILIEERLPLVTSRFVTHLTTDRPLYHPGDVVRFRSLTLERFSHKPASGNLELQFRLVRMLGNQEQDVEVFSEQQDGTASKWIGSSRLQTADGKPYLGPDGKELTGVGAGSFRLPETLPGGEYSLIVREAFDRFPPEKRSFLVNRYTAPRLARDVELTKKSYGPGDIVTALCKVSPVEGGRVLANMRVVAQCDVDGVACKPVSTAPIATDERGHCIVQFQLPAVIERGEGVLSVQFTDGASVETTVEPIPIVVKKLLVEFFPEGGDLVAGTTNRVYFQARTPLLKPAEIRGRIVDRDGRQVCAIQTFGAGSIKGANQGMGRFDFEPEPGQSYTLKLDSPEGIEGTFPLPSVQSDGVVLHLERGVVTDRIDLRLTSVKKERTLLVGAYCRGTLVDSKTVTASAGKSTTVTLTPAGDVAGVHRVTVFEIAEDGAGLRPVAERLLYRRTPANLKLSIAADRTLYAPGDHASITFSATDNRGRMVPAVALVSVVDKGILKLRNERTARSMPTHFLLTGEVRGPEDLEYADFFLLETPLSPFGFEPLVAQTALDLLLGTQGWRRFLEQKTPAAKAAGLTAKLEDVQRLLTYQGQAPQQMRKESFLERHLLLGAGKTIRAHEQVQAELAAAEAAQENGADMAQKQLDLAAVAETSKRSRVAALEAGLAECWDTTNRMTAIAVIFAIGFVVLVPGLALARRIMQSEDRIGWLAGLGSASVICFLIAVSCSGVFMERHVDRKQEAPVRFAWDDRPAGGKADVAAKADGGEGIAFKKPPERAKGPAPKDEDPKALAQFGEIVPAPNNAVAPKERGKVKDIKGGGGANAARAEVMQAPAAAKAADDQIGGEARQEMWARLGGVLRATPRDRKARRIDQSTERLLRKEGKMGDVSLGRLAAVEKGLGITKRLHEIEVLSAAEPFVVRDYRHEPPRQAVADQANGAVRTDFTETLCWHPVLVLPGDRPVPIEFFLSEAVTQFEVQVWAHTLDGRLAAATKDISSRMPFSVDVKVPAEISDTDELRLPLTITNNSDKVLDVVMKVSQPNADFMHAHITNPGQRSRNVVDMSPRTWPAASKIRIVAEAQGSPWSDGVERKLKVVKEGFPVAIAQSGTLKKTGEFTITLPGKANDIVPGSVSLRAQVYPSTLADLQSSLESMLREPHGCFEQTSSSNYPNIMILDFLKKTKKLSGALEVQAQGLLARGYDRLVTFECVDPPTQAKKEGFEWFGGTAPPHPALTAYGLLEFIDMAQHHAVDKAMIERTKAYLLKLRDGKGGFAPPSGRALDSIGQAPPEIIDAYILWALSEAAVKEDLSRELSAVAAKAEKDGDPYQLGLAALAHLNAGQRNRALGLMRTLLTLQRDDGSLQGKITSITGSQATPLAIETTSLALLAWLRAKADGEFEPAVQRAAAWIGKQRGALGGYGSTQSTILALKALIAFAAANSTAGTDGALRIYLNNQEQPAAVAAFQAGAMAPVVVTLPNADQMIAGANTIRLELDGNPLPFTLSCNYLALTPANDKSCPVRLTTELSNVAAREGETLRVGARLKNVSGKDQAMAVAVVGLPAGCTVPVDMQELRELVRARKIDAFEIQGREVILYWRGIAKDAENVVNFSVVCQFPGKFRGSASKGYLYYGGDSRWWAPPLEIDIALAAND
jgi:alpha-2-macroglobulin-like protein